MLGIWCSDMFMQSVGLVPRITTRSPCAYPSAGCDLPQSVLTDGMSVLVSASRIPARFVLDRTRNGEGQTVHQPLDRPPAKSEPRHPSESPDNKVVPLVPRRRVEPERIPDPPDDEDDDDPGPAAA
jgi:hypothetical protein